MCLYTFVNLFILFYLPSIFIFCASHGWVMNDVDIYFVLESVSGKRIQISLVGQQPNASDCVELHSSVHTSLKYFRY